MIFQQKLKLFFIALVVAILLVSCASIPRQEQLLSAKRSLPPQISEGTCTEAITGGKKKTLATVGFSPERITLLNWNIYKGSLPGWESDFLSLSEGKDIIFLQEASLDERLQEVLQQRNLYWTLNNAFSYNGNATGVLLASTRKTLASCGQRTREPLIGIPKTILIARYAIDNSEQDLLVVNVHGINITLGTGSYQNQFDSLEAIVQSHNGPLILAGDFNNWSDGRSAIIVKLINRLSLQAVSFDGERRVKFWGEPVDHILYRGLKPLNREVHLVESSDHNPISVSFRLADLKNE